MGLDRLYGSKSATFTPSQNQPVGTVGGGGGGGGGMAWGHRTNPQMSGRLGAQDWNAQKAQTWADYQAGKLPSQTQGVNLGPNGLADLRAQQANNSAAFGYDANGNWSLLNGGADFTDTYGRSNPYQSVIDQYGMRPTGYQGANSGRIDTTGDRGVPPPVTPPTSAPPSGGTPVDPNAGNQTRTPPPTVDNGAASVTGESEEMRRKRLGLGGLGMKRGNAQAYGGAAQYNPYQSSGQNANGGYGGLGWSSAQGNKWGGGGRSWNSAIWD